jgi:DNA-binding CsgD family transcriptional regulator
LNKKSQSLSERLLLCLDSIYESAVDAAHWPQALHAINNLLSGSGGVYLVFNPDHTLVRADIADVPVEALQLYGTLYPQDARIGVLQQTPAHSVVNDVHLKERSSFERTDLFNLVLRPYDVPYNVFAAIPQPEGRIGAIIVEKLRPAARHQEDLLRRIAPHVTRALRTQRMLGEQRARWQLADDILDRMPYGIALIDGKGVVRRMSRPLVELLRGHQGLYCTGGKLRTRNHQDDLALQAAISRAMNRSVQGYSGTTFSLAVPLGLPLNVTVNPLPLRPDAAEQFACMVLVRDPNTTPRISLDRLMQSYGLSIAEARLAQVMSEGVSLQEAARVLHVSVNTCKTQLNAVYRKSECHNRSELTRAILTLAAT